MSRGRPRVLSDRTCPCGKAFHPRNSGQKYCDDKCYNRFRIGQERGPYVPRTTKICIGCGIEFEVGGRAGSPLKKYHDKKCQLATEERDAVERAIAKGETPRTTNILRNRPAHKCLRCAVVLSDWRRRLCLECSEGYQWCNRCEKVKPLSEFYFSKGKPVRYCKEDVNEHAKRPEKRPHYQQYHRRYHIKHKFRETKISDEQVDALLSVTHCDICGEPPKPGSRLVVDHDHVTGQVRGVICYRCNHFLAALDAKHLLPALIAYLDRASSKQEVKR